MDYAIQLFSVRDGMEQDFEGTLKKVSEMGYKAVEFAGFFGKSAEEVKALLDKYGLQVSGTHTGIDDVLADVEGTIAYHKAIGNKYIIMPGYGLWNQSRLDECIGKVNSVIDRLAAEGITLCYHNHHDEFRTNDDGSQPYEQLLYRTKLGIEVDTYWAYVGMKYPINLLRRLGDRVKFLHIKDGNEAGAGQPLGHGTAPIKEVYDYAQENGIPLVVESETLTPDGLTEAQICIDWLHSIEK